ncbi:MAG: 3-methyl-2-oxobutanoate hydroxymethyltransferase [Candidatus Omnitrophica bacterium]|nr:3-methyl-2-oxobutanoate hydroxymethyltransferase [Candidatus Omnitrophota bacterium]
MQKDKFTVLDFRRKKDAGERITMLTAYDFTMAGIIDEAGIDAVLVGDSLGMVVLGYDSTLPVTMDEMIHHAKAVRRGVKKAFLIGDMPFMSYQAKPKDAVHNAGRFVKEAGCEAVKLEGGRVMLPQIKRIIEIGIPVLGHIGLTPQSVNKFGGYKVRGKDDDEAKRLIDDARALQDAGCFAVILECIPRKLAGEVTAALNIPTIGIGAGDLCSGQVLVTPDLIGYFNKFTPKFVKRYADIGNVISEAVKRFKTETETGIFPGEEHSFK